MEGCNDFIYYLGPDLSIKILTFLEDPSDIVRVASVSTAWRRFVIMNGLSKQICLKMFPEMSSAAHIIEVDNMIEPVEDNSLECKCLERNHKVYAFLARGLNPFLRKECISEAIYASSTDNYPEEWIQNTLEPRDRFEHGASYWSSEGESDPAVPETLIYKLIANFCVITEVHIQPFEAFFQFGYPIYSAKAVRFRMGYPKFPLPIDDDIMYEFADGQDSVDKKFTWLYTSPEFPMVQENCLQKFKLPEPVLCIGGILKIELLGRVQKQHADGLYYICVSHVQVVGRPLSPAFDVEILDLSGRCTLKTIQQQATTK